MTVTIRQVDGLDDPKSLVARSPVAGEPKAVQILTHFMVLSSKVFIGKVDDEIACVWGFIQPSLLSQEAYLWLLTTDLVAEHKFLFIRPAQRFVQQMLEYYPVIVGDCAHGDYKAMRWLRMLRAEFSDSDGKRVPFRIRAEKWTQ